MANEIEFAEDIGSEHAVDQILGLDVVFYAEREEFSPLIAGSDQVGDNHAVDHEDPGQPLRGRKGALTHFIPLSP